MIGSITRFFGGIGDTVRGWFDGGARKPAAATPSKAGGWKAFAEKVLGPERPAPNVWSVGVHRTGQRVRAMRVTPHMTGLASPAPPQGEIPAAGPEESAPPRPPGQGATLNDLLRELDVRESKPEPFTNPLFRYDDIPETPAREPLEPASARPPATTPRALEQYDLQTPPPPRGAGVNLRG